MLRRAPRVLIGLLGLISVPLTITLAAPAHAQVRPCSAGLVALTFDDGPSPANTPRLLRVLGDNHVPATFFMVGSRVANAPRVARRVAAAGFEIGNHTWSHPDLTRLSSGAVRHELRSTRIEFRSVGLPITPLMRPPYGAINDRVRAVVSDLGMVPVLWNVDSRDWAGGNSSQIAGRILAQLRPHEPNIVLQHDGVTNSPASIGAVAEVVRKARARGYCFTDLTRRGTMATPVPSVRATVTDGSEAGPTPVRVLLRLSKPTTRRVSVRVQTTGVSATPGVDYQSIVLRVGFPSGTLRHWVTIPVYDDKLVEPTESFRVLFAAPSGLVVPRPQYLARITSDDVAPPTS